MPDTLVYLMQIEDECLFLLRLTISSVEDIASLSARRHLGTRNYAAAMGLIWIGNSIKHLVALRHPDLDLSYPPHIAAGLQVRWEYFPRLRNKLAHELEVPVRTVWETVLLHVPPLLQAVQADLALRGENGSA